MRIAFSDTKPYDRDYFGRAAGADRHEWQFHEFRRSSETAGTAHQVFLTHDALSEIARVTVQNVGRRQAGDAFLDGTTL